MRSAGVRTLHSICTQHVLQSLLFSTSILPYTENDVPTGRPGGPLCGGIYYLLYTTNIKHQLICPSPPPPLQAAQSLLSSCSCREGMSYNETLSTSGAACAAPDRPTRLMRLPDLRPTLGMRDFRPGLGLVKLEGCAPLIRYSPPGFDERPQPSGQPRGQPGQESPVPSRKLVI